MRKVATHGEFEGEHVDAIKKQGDASRNGTDNLYGCELDICGSEREGEGGTIATLAKDLPEDEERHFSSKTALTCINAMWLKNTKWLLC